MDSTRVVLHPVHGPGLKEALAEVPAIELVNPPGTDEVVDALGSAAVLVTYLWDDRFLHPGLRWVQAISAGIDQFPSPELARRGIVLTSARGAHSPVVAEHALALLLALVRGVGRAMRRAVRHEWATEMAHEAGGMTVAILGLGSIGEEIAGRAAALGMRVVGMKRNPDDYRGVAEKVVGPAGLRSLLDEADAAICALPAGPETDGLLDAAALAALGRGWLVNVGRGATVDEGALVTAIREGSLRGAALDVTAVEPLPDESPLWDLENVIITPHMAWTTPRLTPRLVEVFRANLDGFLGKGPWHTRVV